MAAPALAFSHIGVYVTDLERMAAFYSRFLGFTVTDRGRLGEAELVFLSRDPAEHHQIVLVAGRPAQLAFNPINQISFRVDGFATLRALYSRLCAERHPDVAPVSHGNALSVYFRDPEGNRIELFIDTPWYVEQPLRIPMELDRSDEDVWRWAEETARRQPGFRPAAEWRAEMARRMKGG